jgi:hypothetical protein
MATPPAESPSPVRLRLVFESRRLLRRAQREDGLRRCWLLLRPELATVADLSAHVAARFRLRRSCPGGIVFTVGHSASPRTPLSPFADPWSILSIFPSVCWGFSRRLPKCGELIDVSVSKCDELTQTNAWDSWAVLRFLWIFSYISVDYY